jgi:hypothetical protein
LATCLVAVAQDPAATATAGRVPKPVIEVARGGQCVEDPAYMRRNHMQLLKHQRGDTLRGGVRTGKYSLKACIECHASQSTNSVSATNTNFCQSCHTYAAVTLDCFGCHANQPAKNAASTQSPHETLQSQSAKLQSTALLTQQQVKP